MEGQGGQVLLELRDRVYEGVLRDAPDVLV
jgi:hypothetical protein